MTKLNPYAGLRVLEIAEGIAGSYCGKMMADAGAEVVKIERPGGDPTRRWRVSEQNLDQGASGTLFSYLNAGKKSVVSGTDVTSDVADLFHHADLVVIDGSAGWDVPAVQRKLGWDAATVVVSVTPFGLTGPYVDTGIDVTEFVLQAMCGSIGSRGWPDEMPLQAGGRIGEWVAGVYSAVAAAAALRRSRRTGLGDVIDVSMYECMVITMGGLGAVSSSVMGDDQPMIGRSIELPSIVPTSDGLVGFCTITAQQFADFLVLIDRADLLEDAELASFAGRARRRDEFLDMVNTWAATRTTAEIVELAVALRIPVAPIGTPATVAEIDHFQDRGVFIKNSQGHLQPRVPYRSEAFDTSPPGEVPEIGSHTGTVKWAHRTSPPIDERISPTARPLEGIRIADFTAFWAGPSATHTLASLGADVIKIEGLRRPDGMRYSGGRPATWDQWWEWGPVFLSSNSNKRGLTLELSHPRAREVALDLISTSDLVIENFSPRVMANFQLEWDDVRAANPRATMVRMPAFGLDGPWRDRVGFAQTMEQASGMAWLTGTADGPPLIPRGVCDPIAGLHAAFASIAALEIRDRTGAGMQVESIMVEAALNVAAEALLEASAGGEGMSRDGNRGPEASPQGVYRCDGDDEWVAVAVRSDKQWQGLARLLGRSDLAENAATATEAGRRAMGEELDAAISAWLRGIEVQDAVKSLRCEGIAAARVNPPADLLNDEQLRSRGFWEEVTHPVVGTFLTTGMPFRFTSIPGQWVRSPAPVLGQHNHEVLADVLGMSQSEIDKLEEDRIIGVRPIGL
ncbi:CoA transferase [Rhodococcus sp. IEGM 1366]|uniref:CaiB/BaiF CoA-transferase family protein n=1 Tax=Rhodococcus sp. IEGM 1366 TaxID=3082223 RepID=UPI002955C467|nr:CoA transferase [Rhodococcus sp. IEGM 1366]MDV8071374.1 CoA transferase [Rhodococcus sp. IEGM 1366]